MWFPIVKVCKKHRLQQTNRPHIYADCIEISEQCSSSSPCLYHDGSVRAMTCKYSNHCEMTLREGGLVLQIGWTWLSLANILNSLHKIASDASDMRMSLRKTSLSDWHRRPIANSQPLASSQQRTCMMNPEFKESWNNSFVKIIRIFIFTFCMMHFFTL